ncbi:MAG: hypothetical protein M3235_07035 [Actinomycetota bacterium]|nr:hypothetical protein [Actinomycetota bacterium]
MDERVPEHPFDSPDDLAVLRERLGIPSRVDERRVLVFQRAEHLEAARRWPDH